MNEQVEVWRGKFGKEYTDRNDISWQDRFPVFRGILDEIIPESVLEVGCNRGHNLVALTHILGDKCGIIGVEPNEYAATLARRNELTIFDGTVYDLRFEDGEFDLVFTAGVLIHIPLDKLNAAMSEIYRVSNRYILALEYFSETETDINYRGRGNLLWKRNFPKIYMETFPDLFLLKSGICTTPDKVCWWLWRKGK